MPRPVFGVVEIADDPTMPLLIGGIFIATLLAVGAIAWIVLAKARSGEATTWKADLQGALPVSKRTFDRIAEATVASLERPQVSDATRAQLDRLARTRGLFASAYRMIMIGVGLAGLAGGILLLRSHTPANMNGLPGGIVVLLSLGALLKGLAPGPAVVPMEPLDRASLDAMTEKIQVRVSTQPLTVRLSDSDLHDAGAMLRRGVPIAEAVRAVYPDYDALDEFNQRALESAIRQAAG
jgi:hypothetical protein